jgi:hypothetical protein
MPVLVIADLPGGTAEQDDETTSLLELAAKPPAGRQLRVAGPTETGWRIVSLWDSREAFDAFQASRLAPALEKMGRPMPSFEFWPIERVSS